MLQAQAPTALMMELETSISGGSPEQRAGILRRVTGLFLNHSGALSADQTELFDDVIERLAERMESNILRELADKIAVAPDAPLNVTRLLARREIDIARSILINSTRLSEDDLLDIVRTQGQQHLLAVASRNSISERVTDVLVERGDREVVHQVAGNAGAQLSDEGFSTLLQRSQKDESLQERLGSRSNIEPARFRALMSQATERVRQRLLAKTRQDSAGDPLAALIDTVLADNKHCSLDYQSAEIAIDKLQREHKLGEADVAAFMAEGKGEEVIVVLARLSGLKIDVVESLWFAEQDDGLIILAKSLGFQWPTVRRLISAGRGLAVPEQAKAALEKFMCLTQVTAQRVARFWQVRQSALAVRPAA